MSDPKVDLSAIKEKAASSATPAATAKDKELYQHFTSARISTCFITPGGKRVNFTNYEYYTKDPEIIAYLEKEIASNPRCGVTVGEKVAAEDINPMAALKRKHIQEFLESQKGRDFSAANVTEEEKQKRASIASSADVAN